MDRGTPIHHLYRFMYGTEHTPRTVGEGGMGWEDKHPTVQGCMPTNCSRQISETSMKQKGKMEPILGVFWREVKVYRITTWEAACNGTRTYVRSSPFFSGCPTIVSREE